MPDGNGKVPDKGGEYVPLVPIGLFLDGNDTTIYWSRNLSEGEFHRLCAVILVNRDKIED